MKFFSPEYLQFFKELEANNDREWFNANKSRFQTHVEKPFLKFIEHLVDRFQAIEPNMMLTAKDAVFRIYRDTRFSADKTPYKTRMAAIIAPGGRKGTHNQGAYIELGAQHARIYGGVYQPDKETLRKIREKIAANLDEFERLLKDKKFVEVYGELRGEKNKRLPAEFNDAATKQPLIFNQEFYFFHTFEPEVILSDDLPEKLIQYYLTGREIGHFLHNA